MTVPYTSSSSLLRHPSRLLASRSTTVCLFCCIQRRWQHYTDPDADPDLDGRVERAKNLRTPESLHQRYKDGELVPKPLKRAIGMPDPPRPGENSGRDQRTWRQKRDDFASYERHKERRRQLMLDVYHRNYYRDVGNLGKIHRGKSILAPTTPFRASLAMFFPNLQGMTLAVPWPRRQYRDTTPVIRDHVSVVSLYNTRWAQEQCETFTSFERNPELHQFMKSYRPAREGNLARFVNINVEENWLKAWMIRLCWGKLQKEFPTEQHETYFLNRRGLHYEIRDALGIWNSKVGYVFLVDGQCRVRWAGNGDARDDEKRSLVSCLRRLVDEATGTQRLRVRREEPRPTTKFKEVGLEKHMRAAGGAA